MSYDPADLRPAICDECWLQTSEPTGRLGTLCLRCKELAYDEGLLRLDELSDLAGEVTCSARMRATPNHVWADAGIDLREFVRKAFDGVIVDDLAAPDYSDATSEATRAEWQQDALRAIVSALAIRVRHPLNATDQGKIAAAIVEAWETRRAAYAMDVRRQNTMNGGTPPLLVTLDDPYGVDVDPYLTHAGPRDAVGRIEAVSTVVERPSDAGLARAAAAAQMPDPFTGEVFTNTNTMGDL